MQSNARTLSGYSNHRSKFVAFKGVKNLLVYNQFSHLHYESYGNSCYKRISGMKTWISRLFSFSPRRCRESCQRIEAPIKA